MICDMILIMCAVILYTIMAAAFYMAFMQYIEMKKATKIIISLFFPITFPAIIWHLALKKWD